MAKFYGPVGYDEPKETRPGIFTSSITERNYCGDIIRNTRKLENGDSLNGSVSVNNTISIVSDPYAREHFFAIRYVGWMGVLWTVTNVEVQYPRLILSIGGVYNGAS